MRFWQLDSELLWDEKTRSVVTLPIPAGGSERGEGVRIIRIHACTMRIHNRRGKEGGPTWLQIPDFSGVPFVSVGEVARPSEGSLVTLWLLWKPRNETSPNLVCNTFGGPRYEREL